MTTEKFETYDRTYEVLEAFYEDCYTFHANDLRNRLDVEERHTIDERANALALKDIENAEHNPFSPNGAVLDEKAKADYIKSMQ